MVLRVFIFASFASEYLLSHSSIENQKGNKSIECKDWMLKKQPIQTTSTQLGPTVKDFDSLDSFWRIGQYVFALTCTWSTKGLALYLMEGNSSLSPETWSLLWFSESPSFLSVFFQSVLIRCVSPCGFPPSWFSFSTHPFSFHHGKEVQVTFISDWRPSLW